MGSAQGKKNITPKTLLSVQFTWGRKWKAIHACSLGIESSKGSLGLPFCYTCILSMARTTAQGDDAVYEEVNGTPYP